ncbi:hypothetical protein QP883_05445 [Winkia sp. UMB6473-AN360BR]|nr:MULTISPECIES: hypothetical protein [Winkia]PLB81457.1 hypothetical protein CYJ21_04655 [Actinomyces sp. UMB0138]PMC93125.1 hypothetical protein CJ188_04865 [Actinomyces sp. UMB0918]MBS5947739.1 hypothetical protein [Winkia neuii]MDK7229698.1 hypothetical protein [Winkia sp. UMB1185]MDK8817026.1 hypothetical protein [Winkia sp. UMB6473-AN360BR]
MQLPVSWHDFTPTPRFQNPYVFDLTQAGRAVFTATDLIAGHKYTINALAAEKVFYSLPGRSYPASPGEEVTHTFTAETAEVEVIMTGPASLTLQKFTLTDHAQINAEPHPAQVLGLFAYLPVKGLGAFYLGTSRLNVDALDRPAAGGDTFILDRSRLNQGRLQAPVRTVAWQNIISPVTNIETSRGNDAAGPVRKARAGTMEVTAAGGLDPRVTGMRQGTPIRLVHWPTRQAIFTGEVINLKYDPARPGSAVPYHVKITAADAVAELANITRYGAIGPYQGRNGAELFPDRTRRLMGSARGRQYWINGTSQIELAPTTWETSLANYLDALTASVGGFWRVDRDGRLLISAEPELRDPFPFHLTDEAETDPDAHVWSYTQAATGWEISTAVTDIEANNHSARWDTERLEWEQTDQTVSHSRSDVPYRGARASLDLMLYRQDQISGVLAALIRQAEQVPPPAEITLLASTKTRTSHKGALMAAAVMLETMLTARVTARGETMRGLIVGIKHRITPYRWEIALELTQPMKGQIR